MFTYDWVKAKVENSQVHRNEQIFFEVCVEEQKKCCFLFGKRHRNWICSLYLLSLISFRLDSMRKYDGVLCVCDQFAKQCWTSKNCRIFSGRIASQNYLTFKSTNQQYVSRTSQAQTIDAVFAENFLLSKLIVSGLSICFGSGHLIFTQPMFVSYKYVRIWQTKQNGIELDNLWGSVSISNAEVTSRGRPPPRPEPSASCGHRQTPQKTTPPTTTKKQHNKSC